MHSGPNTAAAATAKGSYCSKGRNRLDTQSAKTPRISFPQKSISMNPRNQGESMEYYRRQIKRKEKSRKQKRIYSRENKIIRMQWLQ